jgi:hypothetical protein
MILYVIKEIPVRGMSFSEILCRVAFVRTEVSEERIAIIIRVTRIG